MNSCNTDVFFSTYYHLQSVRFELPTSITTRLAVFQIYIYIYIQMKMDLNETEFSTAKTTDPYDIYSFGGWRPDI